jgi:hypothetical protein
MSTGLHFQAFEYRDFPTARLSRGPLWGITGPKPTSRYPSGSSGEPLIESGAGRERVKNQLANLKIDIFLF